MKKNLLLIPLFLTLVLFFVSCSKPEKQDSNIVPKVKKEFRDKRDDIKRELKGGKFQKIIKKSKSRIHKLPIKIEHMDKLQIKPAIKRDDAGATCTIEDLTDKKGSCGK